MRKYTKKLRQIFQYNDLQQYKALCQVCTYSEAFLRRSMNRIQRGESVMVLQNYTPKIYFKSLQ